MSGRWTLGTVKARVVSRMNRSLHRRGWELARRHEPAAPTHFYRPVASCQIPDLGFLYELTFGRRTDGLVVEVGAFDG